jgi:hypothetical protein
MEQKDEEERVTSALSPLSGNNFQNVFVMKCSHEMREGCWQLSLEFWEKKKLEEAKHTLRQMGAPFIVPPKNIQLAMKVLWNLSSMATKRLGWSFSFKHMKGWLWNRLI